MSTLTVRLPEFLLPTVAGFECDLSGLAIQVLLLLTGCGSYAFGVFMASMDQVDGDDSADPRLHRLTPPPGQQRRAL